MKRQTGVEIVTRFEEEEVRAFLPHPLPPAEPPLVMDKAAEELHATALRSLEDLNAYAAFLPSLDWFLYGFVRKEAVMTSQIEGTQATLQDVLVYEATAVTDRPDDVREVCNYVEALNYARDEARSPTGLPISARLLCNAHRRLMRGVRGEQKHPGEIRRSQNWIGGTRPGDARFVPPPPEYVPEALASLERWIHATDPLPPLIRTGLAHVQFETIHPFLDGNGRIGRLLIALLLEHWKLLNEPLLYISYAFKRRQQEYYVRLGAVRTDGDWEGWTHFYLECVQMAAEEAQRVASRLARIVQNDVRRAPFLPGATVNAIRLVSLLPAHPMVTLPLATQLLDTSKPTASKAIEALVAADILRDVSGKRRDRIYAYREYLSALTDDEHD